MVSFRSRHIFMTFLRGPLTSLKLAEFGELYRKPAKKKHPAQNLSQFNLCCGFQQSACFAFSRARLKSFLLFIFSKITLFCHLFLLPFCRPQIVCSDRARFLKFKGGGVCSKTQPPSNVRSDGRHRITGNAKRIIDMAPKINFNSSRKHLLDTFSPRTYRVPERKKERERERNSGTAKQKPVLSSRSKKWEIKSARVKVMISHWCVASYNLLLLKILVGIYVQNLTE